MSEYFVVWFIILYYTSDKLIIGLLVYIDTRIIHVFINSCYFSFWHKPLFHFEQNYVHNGLPYGHSDLTLKSSFYLLIPPTHTSQWLCEAHSNHPWLICRCRCIEGSFCFVLMLALEVLQLWLTAAHILHDINIWLCLVFGQSWVV